MSPIVSNDIWQQCLYQLQDTVPTQQFNTWLRPLKVEQQTDQLVISAPNRFVMDWVKDKYLDQIYAMVRQLAGDDFQIVYSDTPGILKPNYKLQETI